MRAAGRSTQALPSQGPAGKQLGNKCSPRELWSPLAGMAVLSTWCSLEWCDLLRSHQDTAPMGQLQWGAETDISGELSKAKRPQSSRAPEPMLSTGSHEETATSRQPRGRLRLVRKGPFHEGGFRDPGFVCFYHTS